VNYVRTTQKSLDSNTHLIIKLSKQLKILSKCFIDYKSLEKYFISINLLGLSGIIRDVFDYFFSWAMNLSLRRVRSQHRHLKHVKENLGETLIIILPSIKSLKP